MCIKSFWLIVIIEVAIVVGKDLGIFCASDSFVHTPSSVWYNVLNIESLNWLLEDFVIFSIMVHVNQTIYYMNEVEPFASWSFD